jgi:preprotein translocase subunit SecY
VLSNLKNIFKVADLRNKIIFTLFIVMVYRFGVALRVPGVDSGAVRQLREAANSQGALGFLNLFSGGAFGSFSIFALGIMPYITASIIMQVLQVVIPKLEEWQQEGATGQRKITQWTRYVAIGIATLQGAGLTFIFGQGRGSAFFGAATQAPDVVLLDPFMPRALLVIPSLVAGTAFLMWLGELISQRGIGNGMSMVIFASIVSGLPYSYYSILQSKKFIVFAILVIASMGILAAVVRVELGQRRIPVQFAKRVVGRRMYGGQSTYIPLKVNQAGVVPIIFASSILLLPVLFSNMLGSAEGWRGSIAKFVNDYLVNSQNMLYITVFFGFIVAFVVNGLVTDWYHDIFDFAGIGDAIRNSFLAAFGATIIAVVLGGLSGVALARRPGVWTKIFMATVFLILVTPEVSMAMFGKLLLLMMGPLHLRH